MEEINLDLEKNTHNNINLSNNDNISLNKVNIVKNGNNHPPASESSIGMELLMNKNKTGDSNQPKEFKSSTTKEVTNTNSRSNSPSLENSNINIELKDIGDTSASLSNTSQSNFNSNELSNSSKIDVSSNDNDINLEDLNLENLFDDNNKNSEPEPLNLNNISSQSNNSFSQQSHTSQQYSEPVIEKSYEELQKEKSEFIRLLERLEQKGIHSHKKFNMNSDYSEVKQEFERLTRRRECDQSVKFQRKMLIAFVTAIEFLNNRFDPFDVKLDGWSESVHENSNDYDDIFEELHEKYKSKATMAPELRLLLTLGGSGFMFHLTNTMFKSSLPGMGDIMQQNPDLMSQFAKAAASTMGQQQQQPGFGNLMGDILGGGNQSQKRNNPEPRREKPKEMSGPPNINDILNNMDKSNNINIDLNSNYSESDVDSKNSDRRNKRTLNLDI
jgi:hypothetical protein